MKDKHLQKIAKRKEHNKQKRIAANNAKIKQRHEQRTYRDVGDFMKKFVLDILQMAEYKEQLRTFVRSRIEAIRKARTTDPKYEKISTNAYDSILKSIDKATESINKLTTVAAKIEAAADLMDKTNLVNQNLSVLGDVQYEVSVIVEDIQAAEDYFVKCLKALTSKETVEFPEEPNLEHPTIEFEDEVETMEEDETRGTGDYEVDVPADVIEAEATTTTEPAETESAEIK